MKHHRQYHMPHDNIRKILSILSDMAFRCVWYQAVVYASLLFYSASPCLLRIVGVMSGKVKVSYEEAESDDFGWRPRWSPSTKRHARPLIEDIRLRPCNPHTRNVLGCSKFFGGIPMPFHCCRTFSVCLLIDEQEDSYTKYTFQCFILTARSVTLANVAPPVFRFTVRRFHDENNGSPEAKECSFSPSLYPKEIAFAQAS